jgi:hypothetical protein
MLGSCKILFNHKNNDFLLYNCYEDLFDKFYTLFYTMSNKLLDHFNTFFSVYI